MASLLNYTAHRWEELTVFHNELFLRYSAFDIDDNISPDNSVSRIGSSRLTSSSARMNELAAQKKRALLQQQLHDAEAEA